MAAPPCGESLPFIIEDRLQYSLELLRRTPKSLVERLETPWYHPSLYDDHMLKTIQDSIACCAMYNARNERNKPSIIRILMARTKELADTPIPPSPSEALARCQALLMYHLIGLLDEDIQLRANTQMTLPVLRDAARSLIELVAVHETQYNLSNMRQLPLFPIAETEAFWRAWLFAESARRTALLSFNFIVLYEIMTRKGVPECGDSMRCERFSLQKHLWSARNAVDFAVAWKTKKHLIMKCETFEEIIREAEPSDLDEFGRMLLICFMGKEETRGWFASRGGAL
ncbi:unnamed protein product [Parascedosporium putredinis]|uniref:Transcription factor gsfR2 n=1 Tax=Parascedosporium putredinis TaxID=1442378 RepID=A0A9P1H164_9PEZI|nr:unnamed protein product [Parascedosporium putredinis]CAI7994827.1 unnamed protein product [Parascedosporium putredinis]